MTDSEKIPFNSYDLIEWLDKVYPKQTYSPSDNISKIMFYEGRRSVVDFLLNKKEIDVEDDI